MKAMIVALSGCLLLAAAGAAQAQSGDGYDYIINADNTNTITLTSYFGPGGVLTVPTSINGLTVTDIGDSAGDYDVFGDGVTSVTVPGSVVTIGTGAFINCPSLENITIANGVRNILEAFYGNILSSVTIPASVTNIAALAFYCCDNLTSVYFTGDAPANSDEIFVLVYLVMTDHGPVAKTYYDATVYYLPGTTGWGTHYGGAPTALWLLPNPVILNNTPTVDVQNNTFGFTISWATNSSVVVEVCTNLAHQAWLPVATNSLIGGVCHYSEPLQANSPARYYRVEEP